MLRVSLLGVATTTALAVSCFYFLGGDFLLLLSSFGKRMIQLFPPDANYPCRLLLRLHFCFHPSFFLSFLLVHMHFAINMLRLQAKRFSHFILSRLLTRIDFLISILQIESA
jgi:hypothetical protein